MHRELRLDVVGNDVRLGIGTVAEGVQYMDLLRTSLHIQWEEGSLKGQYGDGVQVESRMWLAGELGWKREYGTSVC